MIPLRDANPSATPPIVTIVLIIINSLAFFYQLSLGSGLLDRFILQYGVTPYRFTHFVQFRGGFWDNALVPLFTSIFMHGGLMHIVGNMWFLWIFGDNVEDRLGHVKFLLFYLLCGIGASLIHIFFHPLSKIPTIGASGAISGVLGAYLVSFPHARIYTLFIIIIIIRFIEVPAFLFLIFWFVFQFMSGTSQLASAQDTGGVAYWAHMGGFVLGIILLFLFPKSPKRTTIAWRENR